jgi:DNA polymerase III subunit epsilon
MPIFSGRTLVVVDTETTGFDPTQGHELVEVARVTIENGAMNGEWSSLIRPSRPIPPDASAVHGITDAMTASAPAASEVAKRLRADCANHPLVFHNAPFDLPFLRVLLRGAGAPPFDAPVIDTLGLARGRRAHDGTRAARARRTLGNRARHRHTRRTRGDQPGSGAAHAAPARR